MLTGSQNASYVTTNVAASTAMFINIGNIDVTYESQLNETIVGAQKR